MTVCLLLEVSCFWLFVKLLVYYIKVESFAIQDYRGGGGGGGGGQQGKGRGKGNTVLYYT